MSPEHRQLLFFLASLLRYPDTELLDTVQSLHTDDLVNSGSLPPCINTFLTYVDWHSLEDLQRTYVATFDADNRASLYLTTHVYGDSPLQSRALITLHTLYRDAGFTPLPGELPDYLPLVLEFLSMAPEWACASLCRIFAPVVAQISLYLQKNNNPYAPLLHSAGDVLLAHATRHKEVA